MLVKSGVLIEYCCKYLAALLVSYIALINPWEWYWLVIWNTRHLKTWRFFRCFFLPNIKCYWESLDWRSWRWRCCNGSTRSMMACFSLLLELDQLIISSMVRKHPWQTSLSSNLQLAMQGERTLWSISISIGHIPDKVVISHSKKIQPVVSNHHSMLYCCYINS